MACSNPAPTCDGDPVEEARLVMTVTGRTDERGGIATVSAVLADAPSADVAITFVADNPVGVTISTLALTFTPADWNQPHEITLTGVDDHAPYTGLPRGTTIGVETVASKDPGFDCLRGFAVVPHADKACGDDVIDTDLGEECDAIHPLRSMCPVGVESCEVCSSECKLIPGIFRAICGDGRVTDVEQCEPGDTTTCTRFGLDRGVVTCTTDTCQWDTTACRSVADSCATAEDTCTDCLVAEVRHTCVPGDDGFATCWGLDLNGVTHPPTDVKFSKVVDTALFSCGLALNGSVRCWGLAPFARNDPGPYVDLVAGHGFACARASDGAAICWGENGKGQATVPAGRKFRAISAGRWHACGVTDGGETLCWGRLDGELAHVPANETFTSVAAGKHRSCGLRADGTVKCWGGGLGCIDPAGTFESLVGGPSFVCGLRTDHAIECFHAPFDQTTSEIPSGELRDLDADPSNVCAVLESGEIGCFGLERLRLGDLTGPFTKVSVDSEICGVRTNGQVWCFDPEDRSQFAAARQRVFGQFVEVHAGASQSGCARKADGTVQCWGDFEAPIGAFDSISVSGLVACGVRSDASVGCWGPGTVGFEMPEFDSFSRVSASWSGFACGVRLDGSLLCFGNPDVLAFDGRFTLTPPTGHFLDVSAGVDVVCALEDPGTNALGGLPVCFGAPGSRIDEVPPGRFTKVVAARTHACGLRTDGTTACWGQPELLDRPDAPTRLPPVGPVEELKLGDVHGCARIQGKWRCFGDDAYGRASPKDRAFAKVAVGEEVVCGVTARGDSTCWFAEGRVVNSWDSPAPLGTAAGFRWSCKLQANGLLDCASRAYADPRQRIPLTSIVGGPTRVCGLAADDGEARCYDVAPPLVFGPSTSIGAGFKPFIAIGVGLGATCRVNHENKVGCSGILAGLAEPPETLRLKTVAVEAGRACGVTTDDTLGCWGLSEGGRPDGAPIRDVQLSVEHGCVLTTSGAVQCWGMDDRGNTQFPAGSWTSVDVGAKETCATNASGALVCRGWFARGR